MSRPLKAVLFDYGNTLIAFGPDQQAAQSSAMIRVLQDAGRQVDAAKLDALRHQQVMRPYERNGVENDFTDVCREVVELTGPDDSSGSLTRAIMNARQQAFIGSVSVSPDVPPLLERLQKNYQLGVLSNYPCTTSIIESLRHLDLLRFFPHIVVSSEVGYAKPHPNTFQALLKGVDADPEECLYIGDNWLADVQGAKRAGLRTVWLREHIPYETFSPVDGDVPADAELERLTDLESLLDSWETSL
jgi:HAD superfamily hydrolase (TIGR01549 family)